LTLSVLALLAACSPRGEASRQPETAPAAAAPAVVQPVAVDVPAGAYKLDKAHASLIFRVDHLGFSNYTARFKRFDADLQFDPANPTASRVNATVDARSLETDYPDPATLDFNAQLLGPMWLDAAKNPQITFRTTAVEVTGPNKARITGDFTLRGVTKPLVLDATFNGGYRGHPMDPHARIGFSARGTLKRSDYGMTYGIPAPGTKMGVGDNVEVLVESEFTGPPLAASAPPA
jgi:polyisoprenoid-binding protein YceI